MSDDVMPATFQLVISVDARRSGEYDDGDKPGLRKQLYHVVGPAFSKAVAHAADVHHEDRGDGILATVAASVPPSGLLGPWLLDVHERLRESNRNLARPLGLRIGMHLGPVRGDAWGVSGRAVDLACRLADCQAAREALDHEQADLVCVVSDPLFQQVVGPGGWGIDPAAYRSAVVPLKEGLVTAWFHLPGRGRPGPAGDTGAEHGAAARGDAAPAAAPRRDARPGDARPASTTEITVGRDQHHHHSPVYNQPVHFGDNNTGPAQWGAGAEDE